MRHSYSPIVSSRTPFIFVLNHNYDASINNFTKLAIQDNLSTDKILREHRKQAIRSELEQFISKINSLTFWQENWDRNNSAKPIIEAIENAKIWGARIYDLVIQHGYEWRKPFISADEEGNIVFEWWYKDRNLTLDISHNEIAFSEIRDADTSPKISSGILIDTEIASKLKWLILGF